MTDIVDVAPTYRIWTCLVCGGKMCAAERSGTVRVRFDDKLHAVPMYHMPCQKCESCDWYTTDASADEHYVYFCNKYLNEKGLNTWRHKLVRAFKRRWNLLETMFYRGPMWQWRRERRANDE